MLEMISWRQEDQLSRTDLALTRSIIHSHSLS